MKTTAIDFHRHSDSMSPTKQVEDLIGKSKYPKDMLVGAQAVGNFAGDNHDRPNHDNSTFHEDGLVAGGTDKKRSSRV